MSKLPTLQPHPTAQKVFAKPVVLVPSLVLITSLPGTATIHPALRDYTFGNLLTFFSSNVLNLAHGALPERPGALHEFKGEGLAGDIMHCLSLCAPTFATLTGNKLTQQEITDFGKFINAVSQVHKAEDYTILTLDQRQIRLEECITEHIKKQRSPSEIAPALFWRTIQKPRNREILQLDSKTLVKTIVGLIKATVPWPTIMTAYLAAAPRE